MKNFNLITAATVTICTGLFTTNAFAGNASPLYLGATIGQSSVANDANQLDNKNFCASAGATNEICDIGDGDTVGHIYGGIQLSDSIAVEVGYANLGNTASYYYSDPIDIQQETSGYTLAGVVRHRITKTSPLLVYGKAGVIHWTSEAESTIDYPGTAKSSGTSPMAGAGVEFEMSNNMSLKAGWDRYFEVGEGEQLLEVDHYGGHSINTLATDVDVYSAGVNFSFY